MDINRIILIGNGFDLAHDKKTSYKNFIESYWFNRIQNLRNNESNKDSDLLCKISTWESMSFQEQFNSFRLARSTNETDIFNYLKTYILSGIIAQHYNSLFFEKINQHIQEKGWVDIEYQYYRCLIDPLYHPKSLNLELKELTNKLVEYLNSINIEITPKPSIKNNIFALLSTKNRK